MNQDASSQPLSFRINRFLAPRLLEAWLRIRFDGEVADRCVASIARVERLGSRDRRRLAEATFTALRRRGSVDALLADRAHDPESARLWLATALEQDWPDGPAALPFVEKRDPLQEGNLPPLVYECLRDGLVDPLTLGQALRRRAPTTLRCATQTRDVVAKQLRRYEVETQPTPYARHGLICAPQAKLSAVPSKLRAAFEIQDEGSQLLAELVGAQPGDRVLDACAGAGGKTLALLDYGAHVTASDIDPKRLARLKRRVLVHAERLTIRSTPETSQAHAIGSFDRVLIDAPCSGTGTARRAPDLPWRLTGAQLEEYVTLQRSLLEQYSRAVRPGGYLVYATCSILPQENDAQVADFLSRHPDFERSPIGATLTAEQADALDSEGYLRTMPHLHGADGFFGALLRRLS
ncbi:MAG: RsmB/NOP family class I SAM-dependent RNA methyltransferase [Myxococcota bacterium]|nr:RsmB/NOP family class I SAM-dependent RNA methyltransferase [Myxococcota bacterium]